MSDQLSSPPTHFEGPEKLLEIWFAPSPAHVPNLHSADGLSGLRAVPRQSWEDMLDIVKCKVLSVIRGSEMDAYLLSESSLFVSPHRVILKTCGTTLNLLGLPRILEIAANEADMHTVYRFFYSRKSFMFPERQQGPHRDWKQEVEYLDQFFKNGAAYTVGKVNGDHWLLYLTNPEDSPSASDTVPPVPHLIQHDRHIDYTIEILMSDLSQKACQPFFFSDSPDSPAITPAFALDLSEKLGISHIFPPHLTHLDAYAFQPCGYSSNALIKWGHESLDFDSDAPGASSASDFRPGHSGEGYYTIHVTPEDGWSYASFECNIPLSTSRRSHEDKIPDLQRLITRVVDIFQPGRITVTLFISSQDNDTGEGESAVEAAQRAFKVALTGPEATRKLYKRTDKINYEFGGYDLAFASFESK